MYCPTVLQELYRTLQYCGVAWKKNGPYNLKCRAMLRLRAPPPGDMDGGGGSGSQAALSRQLSGVASDDGMALDDPSPSQAAGGGPLSMAVAADDARMDGVAPGVRRPSGAAAAAEAAAQEREVKFEAQLYKMRDGEYSLDFQVSMRQLSIRHISMRHISTASSAMPARRLRGPPGAGIRGAASLAACAPPCTTHPGWPLPALTRPPVPSAPSPAAAPLWRPLPLHGHLQLHAVRAAAVGPQACTPPHQQPSAAATAATAASAAPHGCTKPCAHMCQAAFPSPCHPVLSPPPLVCSFPLVLRRCFSSPAHFVNFLLAFAGAWVHLEHCPNFPLPCAADSFHVSIQTSHTQQAQVRVRHSSSTNAHVSLSNGSSGRCQVPH